MADEIRTQRGRRRAYALNQTMSYPAALLACVSCNVELQAGIFTPEFLPILGMIASQFVVVGGLVSLLQRLK